MRGLRVLLRRHPLLTMAAVCMGLAAAWIAMADSYPPGTVDIEDVYDLDDWFRDQQEKWLPLMPPADDPFMQTGHPKALPFDPLEFPQECKAGLVGDVEHGVPVYDLFLVEDPTTREFVIFNVDYDEVCSLAAPTGYDPAAFAKEKYPDLYSGNYSTSQIAWILEVYDPSRVQIAVRLIPEAFFDAYLEAEEAAASLAAMSLGGISMMCSGTPGYTGIWVCAEGPESGLSNEVAVTVHLPDGFTNAVDVFSVDTSEYDGTHTVWYAVATNLQASGTNLVIWSNSPAHTAPTRFYTAGSVSDEDGDGLSSASEILTYKSKVDDIDSDDDGYVDGPSGVVSTNDYPEGTAGSNGFVIGELSLRTDPTDDDVSPPTVTITWPTNGFAEVWVP